MHQEDVFLGRRHYDLPPRHHTKKRGNYPFLMKKGLQERLNNIFSRFCKSSFETTKGIDLFVWPAAVYVLLGRQDLAMSTLARERKYRGIETSSNMNVISMSTPYMLNLHPMTISSTIYDAIRLEGTKVEDTDSVDRSMTDDMEHIFNSSTQFRYGRDLRLNDDLQHAQLWHLAQRTTSLPLGRGAFTLETIYTLLTEAFTVPKLVLACRLPAQQNVIVNLDPNITNSEPRFSTIHAIFPLYPH
ncbi:hypothetical protein VNO77_03161 [Canavalia gladiata]|uniref:Uncharacterized protein n=1 Tax=Canavalia gladiata TaxID=3824 RepID=A0AAN9MU87_CANGL